MIDGLLIGLWGFVWVRLLCQPGEIFGFVARWMYWLWQAMSLGDEWGEGVYKAVCGCAKCHAGQVAFWSAFICDRSLYDAFVVFIVAVASAHFLSAINYKMETW